MRTRKRVLRRLFIAAVGRLARGTALSPWSPTPGAAVSLRLPPVPAGDGAEIVHEEWLDDRTVDLLVSSPALGGTGAVRLFVPGGWREETDRTWPTLWLLHGSGAPEEYRAWDHYTDVKEFTADAGVIVVMPTDGPAGSYTRWRGPGGPDWETFHTLEVRQLVDRNYRGGPRRAVAGISIGGYGALAYAFRQPGTFAAAASYSGVPDTLSPGSPTLIKGNVLRYGLDVYAMWGDDVLDRDVWREHNPADHVRAMQGTALYVSAGNGRRGPFDGPLTLDLLEGPAQTSARSFLARAAAAGVPVTADLYGDGTHSWPYWERALHRSWPVLAEAMGLRRVNGGLTALDRSS